METLRFLVENRAELGELCLQHLRLVLLATLGATAVGVPLGVLLTRRRWLLRPVIALANVAQTIPSLALFGFLIPVLGSYAVSYTHLGMGISRQKRQNGSARRFAW